MSKKSRLTWYFMCNIGMNVRNWRQIQGKTQAWVTSLTGISQTLLSRYENGDRRPGTINARKIEAATSGEVAVKDWWLDPRSEPLVRVRRSGRYACVMMDLILMPADFCVTFLKNTSKQNPSVEIGGHVDSWGYFIRVKGVPTKNVKSCVTWLLSIIHRVQALSEALPTSTALSIVSEPIEFSLQESEVSPVERERAQKLCDELGLSTAARRLGLLQGTLLRVLVGARVRRGTVALLRQALCRLEDEERIKLEELAKKEVT